MKYFALSFNFSQWDVWEEEFFSRPRGYIQFSHLSFSLPDRPKEMIVLHGREYLTLCFQLPYKLLDCLLCLTFHTFGRGEQHGGALSRWSRHQAGGVVNGLGGVSMRSWCWLPKLGILPHIFWLFSCWGVNWQVGDTYVKWILHKMGLLSEFVLYGEAARISLCCPANTGAEPQQANCF